jgi:hypothetical protein
MVPESSLGDERLVHPEIQRSIGELSKFAIIDNWVGNLDLNYLYTLSVEVNTLLWVVNHFAGLMSG